MRRIPLWYWWIAVVWAISLPWVGFTFTPQWQRVHWIPFTDPADRPKDLIANVVLLLPFGISFARGRRGNRRFIDTALAAAALSISAEATQLFGTLRYPSATDVTSAVLGSLAGAAWMAWVERD